ncbi:hypothetical protein [Paenibacillus hamazuiensis]|uniref:hypothetical protein n=1 Tax=Paenibacillus hamazuiensis TaxID=2936508 RepID=UPI00200E1006|nr:hypothetical protein [Paenibacillus hamazuiensis]
MNVGTARMKAAEWVMRYASGESWFRGAYFSGSTVGLPDEAQLSAASDIDVVIATAHAEPPLKPGKFRYDGVLVEATYLSANQLSSAEAVLESYHLAGSFRTDTIISDPAGHLRTLQQQVSRRFAERYWVYRRCENVRQKIENGLRAIDTSAPFHDLVTSWLFPTGITTHMLLVAALRNPTVRLRYLAAQDVLDRYGLSGFYSELLELLGCARMTPERTDHHLEGLASTFDAAASAAKTPFFFSTDVTPSSRPIAIDGSRELILSGRHREAVFWMVATFARCHKIFAADAPHLQKEHEPAFKEIMTDLGFSAADDYISRAADVSRFLPRLWTMTEAIISANPDISQEI